MVTILSWRLLPSQWPLIPMMALWWWLGLFDPYQSPAQSPPAPALRFEDFKDACVNGCLIGALRLQHG
jgi:hypothetical protein